MAATLTAELNVAVVWVRARVPAPVTVPGLFWVRLPPTTVNVRPLGTVMVPALVKLGLVPDWMTLRSPPLRLMVPLLLCAAEAGLTVKVWETVRAPWLLSWAPRVREPPPWAPGSTFRLAPGALTSVPLVTVSDTLRAVPA